MANLLVLLELRHGAVLPVSLEALGQARRVASTLGATLYALVPLPEAPAYGDNDIIALCARHGADKVVLLTDEGLSAESEMRFGTHGRAVLAACDQLPPTLILMGSSPGARDLAPRVAARLGAAYLPDGFLSAAGGRLLLCNRTGRPLQRDENGTASGLEHAVVITVPPGRYQAAVSVDDAEMVIVAAPPAPRDFIEVERVPGAMVRLVSAGAEDAALGHALDASPTGPAALVVTLGGAVTPMTGAVQVALGEAAAADPLAHYALPSAGAAAELLAELLAESLVEPAAEIAGSSE